MRLNPAQSFLERNMVTLRNVWLNCTLTSKTFSVKYGQSEKLILIAKSWRKLTKKKKEKLSPKVALIFALTFREDQMGNSYQ